MSKKPIEDLLGQFRVNLFSSFADIANIQKGIINDIASQSKINDIRVGSDTLLQYIILNGTLAEDTKFEIIDFLLSKVAAEERRDYVNLSAPRAGSPLHNAADLNCARIMQKLIEFGADVNYEEEGVGFPLLIASQNNNLAALKVLLDNGAEIDKRMLPKDGPRIEHAGGAGSSAHIIVSEGPTSLYSAVHNQNADIVRELVSRGANLEIKILGKSPLFTACALGNVEIAEILLGHGADAKTEYLDKTTALMMTNSPMITKLLLDYGANIDAQLPTAKVQTLHDSRHHIASKEKHEDYIVPYTTVFSLTALENNLVKLVVLLNHNHGSEFLKFFQNRDNLNLFERMESPTKAILLRHSLENVCRDGYKYANIIASHIEGLEDAELIKAIASYEVTYKTPYFSSLEEVNAEIQRVITTPSVKYSATKPFVVYILENLSITRLSYEARNYLAKYAQSEHLKRQVDNAMALLIADELVEEDNAVTAPKQSKSKAARSPVKSTKSFDQKAIEEACKEIMELAGQNIHIDLPEEFLEQLSRYAKTHPDLETHGLLRMIYGVTGGMGAGISPSVTMPSDSATQMPTKSGSRKKHKKTKPKEHASRDEDSSYDDSKPSDTRKKTDIAKSKEETTAAAATGILAAEGCAGGAGAGAGSTYLSLEEDDDNLQSIEGFLEELQMRAMSFNQKIEILNDTLITLIEEKNLRKEIIIKIFSMIEKIYQPTEEIEGSAFARLIFKVLNNSMRIDPEVILDLCDNLLSWQESILKNESYKILLNFAVFNDYGNEMLDQYIYQQVAANLPAPTQKAFLQEILPEIKDDAAKAFLLNYFQDIFTDEAGHNMGGVLEGLEVAELEADSSEPEDMSQQDDAIVDTYNILGALGIA